MCNRLRQGVSARCNPGRIRELNTLLRIYQSTMDESEFKTLKSNVAQAMGRLIDVEEFSVYSEYPELRPY